MVREAEIGLGDDERTRSATHRGSFRGFGTATQLSEREPRASIPMRYLRGLNLRDFQILIRQYPQRV